MFREGSWRSLSSTYRCGTYCGSHRHRRRWRPDSQCVCHNACLGHTTAHSLNTPPPCHSPGLQANQENPPVEDATKDTLNQAASSSFWSWKKTILLLSIVVIASIYVGSCMKGYEVHEAKRMTVVLLGKRGSGKSATGNTILGREAFKEDFSPYPVTKQCDVQSGIVFGRNITVIDTPDLSNTSFRNELVDTVSHVFLLIIRLGQSGTENVDSVKVIKDTFGNHVLNSTMVLLTGGDFLKSTPVSEFLDQNNSVMKIIHILGGEYHVFDNKARGKRTQVKELLKKIDNRIYKNAGHAIKSQRNNSLLSDTTANLTLTNRSLSLDGGEESVNCEVNGDRRKDSMSSMWISNRWEILGVIVLVGLSVAVVFILISDRKEEEKRIREEEEEKRAVLERKWEEKEHRIRLMEEEKRDALDRKREEREREIHAEEERKREERERTIREEEERKRDALERKRDERERAIREEEKKQRDSLERERDERERGIRVEEERKRDALERMKEEKEREIRLGEERKRDDRERTIREEEERKRDKRESAIRAEEERKREERERYIRAEKKQRDSLERERDERERDIHVEEERKREERERTIREEEERKREDREIYTRSEEKPKRDDRERKEERKSNFREKKIREEEEMKNALGIMRVAGLLRIKETEKADLHKLCELTKKREAALKEKEKRKSDIWTEFMQKQTKLTRESSFFNFWGKKKSMMALNEQKESDLKAVEERARIEIGEIEKQMEEEEKRQRENKSEGTREKQISALATMIDRVRNADIVKRPHMQNDYGDGDDDEGVEM